MFKYFIQLIVYFFKFINNLYLTDHIFIIVSKSILYSITIFINNLILCF